jgi:hypothetical protein
MFALAVSASIACAGCGRGPGDAHVGTRATGPTDPASAGEDNPLAGKPAGKRKGGSHHPVLDGTRCAAFVPFVPNTFSGFRAKGPAEGKDIDLGQGSSLALIKRGYFKNGSALELEFVDTAHARSLRDLFARTRKLERESDTAVIKPLRIQGYDAFAQWNDTARAARVTILVEQVIVNLSLRPSDSLHTSLTLAEQLDLEKLATLQRDEHVARQ